MTLQRQLLLVSLCIFILPWAGCQFIKEMDNTLRGGQISSLQAQARALAITLENSTEANQYFSHTDLDNNSDFLTDHQIYLHPLSSKPIIDGYNSDWASFDFAQRTFKDLSDVSFYFELSSGIYDKNVFLNFSISDPTINFHNPQKSGLANGDHIILQTKDKFLRDINYVLRNSSSGNFIAYYKNSSGTQKPESSIKGYWRELNGGYNIEIQLPLNLLNGYLTVSYVDQHTDPDLGKIKRKLPFISNSEATNISALKFVTYSKNIQDIIAPYLDSRISAIITDSNQWIIAKAANTKTDDSSNNKDNTFWLIKLFYKMILNNVSSSSFDNAINDGRILYPEKIDLDKNFTQTWYKSNSQILARVSTPIYIDNKKVGFVILDQNTASASAATNAAFNRLFFITLGAMVFVSATLLIYASILSFRIRRLRNAADCAIESDGKITQHFLTSSSKDEIGDLTRSYGKLLSQLNEYTEYLRTLASKLSHELRTPLAVIKSSLDNIDPSSLEREATQYIYRASEGAERLSNILNAMSAANRIEESIQDTHTHVFKLDQLLSELVAAYKTTYPSKSIRLIIKEQKEFSNTQNKINAENIQNDFSMNGSPDLIVQMLDKLIDNAVDFCPDEGVITISLHRQTSTSKAHTLVIDVANTGPLLPSHMQSQLFDSLVSLRGEDQNGSSMKNHLGLGLYIVRLISNFHDGQLTANNLPDNSGVVFSVELPASH